MNLARNRGKIDNFGIENTGIRCISGSYFKYDCLFDRDFYILTRKTSNCISAGCRNAMYPKRHVLSFMTDVLITKELILKVSLYNYHKSSFCYLDFSIILKIRKGFIKLKFLIGKMKT